MPNVSLALLDGLRAVRLLTLSLVSPLQTQSQEKIDLLRMLGAEVYPVPGQSSQGGQVELTS